MLPLIAAVVLQHFLPVAAWQFQWEFWTKWLFILLFHAPESNLICFLSCLFCVATAERTTTDKGRKWMVIFHFIYGNAVQQNVKIDLDADNSGTIVSLLDPQLAFWSSVLHPLWEAVPKQRHQAKACVLSGSDSHKRENKRVSSLFILEETSWAKSCTPETEVKWMSPVNDEREGWDLET